MTVPVLTTEQRSAIYASIIMGFTMAEFTASHPEWPQDAMARYWGEVEAEIRSKKLDNGEFWGIPSEW